jgi:hypothetical protein
MSIRHFSHPPSTLLSDIIHPGFTLLSDQKIAMIIYRSGVRLTEMLTYVVTKHVIYTPGLSLPVTKQYPKTYINLTKYYRMLLELQ